mgnify:CR=1 FL=1
MQSGDMDKEEVKKLVDILQTLCILSDKHTGSLTLHVAEGSLVSYEVRKTGKFKDLKVPR